MAAGWWQRVGATVVDALVFLVPYVILIFAVKYVGGFIALVAYAAYMVLMLSRSGQTIGNRAVGTRVVNAETGQMLTTGRALGRWAASFLFSFFWFLVLLPIILDFLWPLWDAKHQTLHDKIAGTLVVRTQ
jgi:uncharacterized RDD family membrane protein YckC